MRFVDRIEERREFWDQLHRVYPHYGDSDDVTAQEDAPKESAAAREPAVHQVRLFVRNVVG